MVIRKAQIVLLAIITSSVFTTGALADSRGEPGCDSSKANPLKNVYFGEQHIADLVHTRVYADGEEMSRLAFIISC